MNCFASKEKCFEELYNDWSIPDESVQDHNNEFGEACLHKIALFDIKIAQRSVEKYSHQQATVNNIVEN